jgi:cell division septal protein FtsQ
MAVNLNPVLKYRPQSVFTESMQFKRKKEKTKTKKIQRRIRLRPKHILLIYILVAGFFFAFQRVYLFLISWEELHIDTVEVTCAHPGILASAERFLHDKKLGNILLFNINHLRNFLKSYRWIEDVRVRKIFPSTLKIEIKERIPAAVISNDSLILIDRHGVHLDKIPSLDGWQIPLFVDDGSFKTEVEEKLNLAWECLDSLAPAERERVQTLDLSEYKNVKMKLKDSSSWLKMGHDQFSEKIKIYQHERADLEKFGSLEYIDLRIQGRIYFKPRKRLASINSMSSGKEAK